MSYDNFIYISTLIIVRLSALKSMKSFSSLNEDVMQYSAMAIIHRVIFSWIIWILSALALANDDSEFTKTIVKYVGPLIILVIAIPIALFFKTQGSRNIGVKFVSEPITTYWPLSCNLANTLTIIGLFSEVILAIARYKPKCIVDFLVWCDVISPVLVKTQS